MKRIGNLLKIILLGLGLGLAPGASAVPIGPAGPPAPESVGMPFLPLPLEGGGLALFYLVFADEPISADPSAGVWLKTLPLDDFVGPSLDGPAIDDGGPAPAVLAAGGGFVASR